MNAGSVATVATVALATLALLGVIIGVIRWFYKRGGDERSFVDGLHANTAAVNRLTDSVSSLQGTLNEHESRIRVLEEREYRIHEYRIKAVEGASK